MKKDRAADSPTDFEFKTRFLPKGVPAFCTSQLRYQNINGIPISRVFKCQRHAGGGACLSSKNNETWSNFVTRFNWAN